MPMPALVEPRHQPVPVESGSQGCFETMRGYRGKIFRLDAHLDRLQASAQSIGLAASVDRARLRRQLTEALARSGLPEAVVRIALLPKPGGGIQPSVVVQRVRKPSAAAYRRGIRVAVVPTRKFPVSVINPEVKYSARLGSVLAVMEAQLRGADEALFMDGEGFVTESTASNLGMVKRGALFLPPCWLGLLAGITRDVLIEVAARLELPVRQIPLTRHDLYNADEALLSSTIKEVLPVTWIDGRRIGTGRPGPVTKRLGRAFSELVRGELRE